jgi:prephenate dehydrogenase
MTGGHVPGTDATRTEAVARLPARIAFLGFGLIGGSIAAALRVAGAPSELVAWTPSGVGPELGMRKGLLDAAAPSAAKAIDGAGLVVLAGPPIAILALVDELGGPLRTRLANEATITDVASTKTQIVERASSLGLPFVGGHPMAGREVSGAAAATEDLFINRRWVVIPAADAQWRDGDRVESLAMAVGALPVRMSPADHDVAVAAISHLPLVVAAALVESVLGAQVEKADQLNPRQLAATGWADTTRLARGDPHMGADILETNASAIAEQLKAFKEVIVEWIELIERQDADDSRITGGKYIELYERLQDARAAIEEDGRG